MRLITCTKCGHAITAEIKKQKYVYYHITGYGNTHKPRYVSEEKIDAQFAEIVSAVTLPEDWYEYIKECLEREWGDRRTAMESQRKRLERSRDQIMTEIKKAYEHRLQGNIAREFFQTIHQDQQRRLDEVDFQLSSQMISGEPGTHIELCWRLLEFDMQPIWRGAWDTYRTLIETT